jgi:opacity protein-like surface antigen
MKPTFATAGLAALLAGPAMAADGHGFYIAADAGVTRADTWKNDFDQLVLDSFAEFRVAVLPTAPQGNTATPSAHAIACADTPLPATCTAAASA